MMDVIRIRAGRIEAAAAIALYGVYELVRGFGGEDWRRRASTRPTSSRSSARSGSSGSRASRPPRPRCPGSHGFSASSTSRSTSRHDRLPRLGASPPAGRVRRRRTTLVVATGLALVGYLPSPPRRPDSPGSASRTRSRRARASTSAPICSARSTTRIAAVPSLHFGYALLVGAGLAVLAQAALGADRRRALPGRDALHHRRHRQPLLRGRGARWAVVVAGWLVARALVRVHETPAASVRRSVRPRATPQPTRSGAP